MVIVPRKVLKLPKVKASGRLHDSCGRAQGGAVTESVPPSSRGVAGAAGSSRSSGARE